MIASVCAFSWSQESPAASAESTIDGVKVKIEYHAPKVKDRIIWGGLVPYDKVWRTGADAATTIELSDNMIIEGNKVPKGKYSLFLKLFAKFTDAGSPAPCEMSCPCTTCHIIVREGFSELNDASETEEDMLDKAWGLEPNSRLSCQTFPIEGIYTVELPKYTINQVSEDH